MANNNSYDKFFVSNKQRLKNLDIGLECSVNLECTESVTKILAVNVDADCGSIESLTGEASVNGTVIVNLVYLTEQGLIGNASYSAPFVSKFIDTKIKPETKVFAKVLSTDAQVKALNSNIAKVDCVITLKGFCLNNDEVEYLSATGGDVCTLQESTTYNKLDGVTNSNWLENLEISIKEPVKQILTSSCDVYVKNFEVGTNFVTINGELTNRIMYLTDEEEPVVKTVYTKTDIKQEIESEYAQKEAMAEVDVCVVKNGIKNNVTEKENEIKIGIEIPLDVCVRIYSTNTINLITDLYSVESLTNATSVSYDNSVVCEPIVFDKKVEGSLTLSEDDPRIDKLLAVNYSKATVTNENIENGEYTVSGVILSNLIYYNEDDNKVNSVDVEVPFVLNCNIDYDNNILTDINVVVEDVDVMVKKGKDVYVDAQVKIQSQVCKNSNGVVIKELEYTEQAPLKDCAIEIYFAKAGEKVWDIAKKLFVKPEMIFNQNPNAHEVLEQDEKLAIYYQKNVQ